MSLVAYRVHRRSVAVAMLWSVRADFLPWRYDQTWAAPVPIAPMMPPMTAPMLPSRSWARGTAGDSTCGRAAFGGLRAWRVPC